MTFKWLVKLDTYANATYGRSISNAVAAGICVSCAKPAYPFADPEAASAYPKTGLCERCQTERRSSVGKVLPFDQSKKTRLE